METEKDRIEKIMEAEDLNASQFAAEIGIKSPTLSHILNGRNNPSLEVLKKILERYRTISSDWLILGVGAMHRGIKQPQTLSLFDDEEVTGRNSGDYADKKVADLSPEKKLIGEKNEQADAKQEKTELAARTPPKLVKKIIVYYDDNSFQEFETKLP